MIKGLGDLLKQAKQLESMVMRIQEDLAQKSVTGSSGGGMVRVTVNGLREIQEIKIEREVVNPDDVEMLEDLVTAATNEALRRANDMMKEEISKLTGGLSIPGII
jgi:hypothetical protein